MDLLTHLVLGAAIGEATLGAKIGRKAMLFGALANTIPDIDVLASPFFSDAQQFMVHRGITHSFFFAIIMAPLLGWFFKKWFRHSEVNCKNWSWLFFLGMVTHVLLDSLTCYGVGWFEPFSNYRVSFNTIFVADPFYTLPFLFFVLLALIAKNGSEQRTKFNKAGLWISSFYLIFTIINHEYIHRVMKNSLKEQKLFLDNFIVTPTPFNNFLWMAYTHDNDGTWIGYYSVFDKEKRVDYHRMQRNDSLLIPFENDESVKILKQFSEGNYIISKEDSILYFNDIRFGQMSGWDNSDTSFAFKFNLNKNADRIRALDRTKYKTSYFDVLSSLVNRIKGNKEIINYR